MELRQVLATLYLNGNDPVLAEEQLEQIVQIKPEVPAYRLQLALLYTRTRKLDDADGCSRKALSARQMAAT